MKGIKFLTTSAFLAIVALLGISSVSAQSSTVIVTPDNHQGFITADTRPGGMVDFIADSTAPNNGNGALQLTTSSSTAKAQFLHSANVPLANITELSYYTKQVSGPPHAAASYQLIVNLCGTSGFTTFVYEPYQNGTVIPGTWQQWDVDSGMFWSSRTVTCTNPDGTTSTVTAGAGGDPFYTLAQLKAAFPNAIVTGFGVNIGSGNPNYNVLVDLLSFNGTTYDFEMFEVAKTQEGCKNGGYKNLRDAQGNEFKNQGQCIQFVNTGK